MSQLLIQNYLSDLDKIRQVSGLQRETVVREAFKDLLKAWGKQQNLVFLAEYPLKTLTKTNISVDGALLHELRLPLGYWEAKDEKDDLNEEIEKKFRKGYPQDNIIFTDDVTAVLVQNKNEILRCSMTDTGKLGQLIKLFFGYERQEIASFRAAVEQFKTDLPVVLEALRKMIERSLGSNRDFRKAADVFLEHAQKAINPKLVEADVREMLIQHILTGEVFAAVFPGTNYHEDNSVARELHKLEATFFTGNTKFQTLKGLEPYYAAIRKAAAQISTHSEKQTFLKVIYEGFYKVYNPKAADRLGVVYTPNEIVRFMIDGADWLCEKHFKRNLIDKDVQILDPAAGTGTFICELLEHFRGQPAKLKHKYLSELHANEVAILPYYVANLNIEATYAAITGEYEEYPSLCFVDTLDNTHALRKYRGHIDDLFGSLSDDNIKRIRRQNANQISVVIGNPPYNANQLNENENNKNREYPEIDKRIKETYIKQSTAQKTKLYDMYSRFFRWASDRLDENGVLALVTNRSFIDSRTFDGFRAVVAKEFNEIYVVDLGGDVRANPKLSGTKHNVFGIQTGVAISFMVKRAKATDCRVFYTRRPELETADDKIDFLTKNTMADLKFEAIRPDAKSNWLNQSDNDFESLLPVATKAVKAAKKPVQEKAIFKLFALGVVTARDDWMYDFSKDTLSNKVIFLVDVYNATIERLGGMGTTKPLIDVLDYSIKWTRSVKNALGKGTRIVFDRRNITMAEYRPFSCCQFYRDPILNEMPSHTRSIFGVRGEIECPAITVMGDSSGKPYFCLAIKRIPDYNFVSPASGGTQTFPLFRLSEDNNRTDNITDWALDQFKKQYQPGRGKKARPITRESIFHYVYAVLHDPIYREKYAQNLKREFPRVPFYADFWQWADWGQELMDLHINYEAVEPFKLRRTDTADESSRKAGKAPKSMLKADKNANAIILDAETTLGGVPTEAWDYKLGNRSALEWILDQYKEKKPKDPTIREKFNTYRFADYKEKVIDLLKRVTSVSVRTVEIVEKMRRVARDG